MEEQSQQPEQQPPSLIHQQTLRSPSGITRAWSSRAHPSPRSPLLATASSDKSVQIWDLRDYKLVSNINGGHKRSVRCVGWKDWIGHRREQKAVSTTNGEGNKIEESDSSGRTPKEKAVTLATGSFDSNVGVWIYDPPSRRQQGGATVQETMSIADELDMTNPPDNPIRRGGDDENDEEDVEDWHFTTLLTGPDSEIKDLQFSPAHYGANLLATCSRDKSVWIWEEVEDDNEWETIAVLGDHTGDVKCVGWCSGAYLVNTDNSADEEDVSIIGSREILATGSYDDTIRLWRDVEEEGDWMCVAVVLGHTGTVWDLCWEGYINRSLFVGDGNSDSDDSHLREWWEPRIVSCSDDMTVRVWTRDLSESEKEKKREQSTTTGSRQTQERLPSIIRPTTTMEKWTEQSQLPSVHVRSIYAVDWSKKTGLVVSCGGDGTIAVYREVLSTDDDDHTDGDVDVVMNGITNELKGKKGTKWIIVALIESAHDEYEVNHVCWAARRDKEKRWDDEEVLISTGDDGDVRIWVLPDGVVQ